MPTEEEKNLLVRRYEEEGGRFYVVKDNQYVLADNEPENSCECCGESCRYFNFIHCPPSDDLDPDEFSLCMEGMPRWISICTNQFSEYDHLSRICDFPNATDWWFRVRFADGTGNENTGCYYGKTTSPDPPDPKNPPGTAQPLGQVIIRQPKLFNYCGQRCTWNNGSIPTGGLPRIIDERNNGCDPDPSCEENCGYWNIEGNTALDNCLTCCEEVCWYQDYRVCGGVELECENHRPGISVICLCSTDPALVYSNDIPETCCPDYCEGECMPDYYMVGTCCYKKAGPMYRVRPGTPWNETPNFKSVGGDGQPCVPSPPEDCHDERCHFPPDPDERWMCKDCFFRCENEFGQVTMCPRNLAMISMNSVCAPGPCIDLEYTHPDSIEDCGEKVLLPGHCGMGVSMAMPLKTIGQGVVWEAEKWVGGVHFAASMSWGGGSEYMTNPGDEAPPFTAGCLSDAPWFDYEALQGGNSNFRYKPCCSCVEDEDGNEDCSHCEATGPCDNCWGTKSVFVYNPGDPGSSYCDWPPVHGPCSSCTGGAECGCAETGVFGLSHGFCNGFWPGDGGYSACHGADIDGCGQTQDCMDRRKTCRFTVSMYASSQNQCESAFWPDQNGARQLVSCNNMGCSLSPVSQTAHMPHESGCGGECPKCECCGGGPYAWEDYDCDSENNSPYCFAGDAGHGKALHTMVCNSVSLTHISHGEDPFGCGENCDQGLPWGGGVP